MKIGHTMCHRNVRVVSNAGMTSHSCSASAAMKPVFITSHLGRYPHILGNGLSHIQQVHELTLHPQVITHLTHTHF